MEGLMLGLFNDFLLQNETTDSPTFAPTFSPTSEPTFAPTPFPELAVNLPRDFLELTLPLKIIIGYVVLYGGISILTISWWAFYPLAPDERVSLNTLLASLWSVFILVGDYYSDVAVTLAILTGEVETDTDIEFNVELFTKVVIGISTSALFVAVVAMAWVGKRDSELNFLYLPFRIIGVALGFYPFYLLGELVTAQYYGGMRAKLGDIVRLKYIQGTVEGIPQIGLLVYLNMQEFSGLQEVVAISICSSIVSLISGIVMWDFVREVYDKDEYVESANDVNYLFYSPHLSTLAIKTHSPCWDWKLMNWLFHSVFTRFLECFGRLAFYSTFALCTGGWGLIGLVFIDVVGMLRYHRFVFFFNVWLELVFNLRDEGNVNIAIGEWKVKLMTTIAGYIVIAVRMSNQKTLIDLEGSGASEGVFYLGLVSNIVLFPWIFHMFRRQRGISKRLEQIELENDVAYEISKQDIRTFDTDVPKATGVLGSVFSYFRLGSSERGRQL